MSASITLVGRLGRDPELRYGAAGGKAVATLTVVTSRRQKNRSGEWEDVDTSWWPCKVFDTLAENAAESLQQGAEVVVVGRAVERRWEDKDGTKRSRVEVLVESIGPGLRWATARVEKTGRAGFQPDRKPASRQQADAPQGEAGAGWDAAGPGAGQDSWAGWSGKEEPPF